MWYNSKRLRSNVMNEKLEELDRLLAEYVPTEHDGNCLHNISVNVRPISD